MNAFISITELTSLNIKPNKEYVNDGVCCGFFLCRSGELVVQVPDKQVVLHRSECYVFLQSTYINILSASADFVAYEVKFSLEYVVFLVKQFMDFEKLYNIRNNPIVELRRSQMNDLVRQCRQMKAMLNYSKTNSDYFLETQLFSSMARALCYEVLAIYFFDRKLTTNKPPLKSDLVYLNFVVDLFTYYKEHRDVAFYAQRQNIEQRYFSAIIKQATGENALQIVANIVIGEAKHLLRFTDLSIKEIATQLNFTSQSFFGKYFKLYTGTSPLSYRNEMSVN